MANHLEHGTIAVGAPGSEARKLAEREDRQAGLVEEYRKQLTQAVTLFPDEYGWPLSELEFTMQRMIVAIDKRCFNKDSRAWRETCKALGIRHTYKAIYEYLDSGIKI